MGVTNVFWPILCVALVFCVVFVTPTYFISKNECTTFAELQQTDSKFTLSGECYVKLNGEWITKDRWYFYKAFSR